MKMGPLTFYLEAIGSAQTLSGPDPSMGWGRGLRDGSLSSRLAQT